MCLDFLVALALNHKVSANRVSGISLLTQVPQRLPHAQHLKPTSLRTAFSALSPRLHLLSNQFLVILKKGLFQPSELLTSPRTFLLIQIHQLYHLPSLQLSLCCIHGMLTHHFTNTRSATPCSSRGWFFLKDLEQTTSEERESERGKTVPGKHSELFFWYLDYGSSPFPG